MFAISVDADAQRLHCANLVVALSYIDPKQAATLADESKFAAIDGAANIDADALLNGFLA